MFPYNIVNLEVPTTTDKKLYDFFDNVVDTYYVNSKNENERLAVLHILSINHRNYMRDISKIEKVKNISKTTKSLLKMLSILTKSWNCKLFSNTDNDANIQTDSIKEVIDMYFPITKALLGNIFKNVEFNNIQNQSYYLKIKNNWSQYCQEINTLSIILHATNTQLSISPYEKINRSKVRAMGYKLFLNNFNNLHTEFILETAKKFGKYPNLLNQKNIGLPSYTGLNIESFYNLYKNEDELIELKQSLSQSKSPLGTGKFNPTHVMQDSNPQNIRIKDKIFSTLLEHLENTHPNTEENKLNMIILWESCNSAGVVHKYKPNFNRVELLKLCNDFSRVKHYILLENERLDQGFQFNHVNFEVLLNMTDGDKEKSINVIKQVWEVSNKQQRVEITKSYLQRLAGTIRRTHSDLIDFSSPTLLSIYESTHFNNTLQNLILKEPNIHSKIPNKMCVDVEKNSYIQWNFIKNFRNLKNATQSPHDIYFNKEQERIC